MSDASYTDDGRVVVSANEWDRLNRLDKTARLLKDRTSDIMFADSETWYIWRAVLKELK